MSQAPPTADASTTPEPAAPTPSQDAPAAPETTSESVAAPATPTSESVTAPATPTPDTPPVEATPAPAAPTQPADSSPNGGDKGGDGDGDGDRNDVGEGNDVNDDEKNGDKDDSKDGGDIDEKTRKHPRSFHARSISGGSRSNIISLEGLFGAPGEEAQGQGQRKRAEPSLPQGRSPRPRPSPHSHIVGARRAITPDNLYFQQMVKAMDIADAYVQFPVTVAMAEQVTTDYLLKVLTGPAASSPLPTPLKALKTTVNPIGAAELSAAADGNGSNNTVAITDLMVSISPAFGGPTGERRFLSMSEPIFGAVVGILSAVVCGVVLMYVVRPLVKRHKKQNGGDSAGGGGGGSAALVHDNESESHGTFPHTSGSRAGGNGYYGDSAAYTGHNNDGSVYFDGRNNDYNPYSSKDAPYSASSTGPTSQPPPMQEVHSEKQTHSHQKNDSNSTPAIFDPSLPGYNTPHSTTVFSAAAALNATDSEDPEYAKKQLELLRKQDQYQAQSVPLPASTAATPIAATTPSITMKDIQSARTRYNWGSNTPTTPSAYSISTPTSATGTIATATPTTAEFQASYLSAFDNTHAAETMSHSRISSLVDAIPEEPCLEPAAPQNYTSISDLTPATSGHRNENADDDDEDDRHSAVSSRNGNDLFYSATKPRLVPSSIDTSASSTPAYSVPSSSSASGSISRDVNGGLASALYRNHRLSMESPGYSPAVQSPLSRSLSFRPRTNFSTGNGNGNDSNNNTPHTSMSNDYLPSRVNIDSTSASYREKRGSIDIQTRYQDLMSLSRPASGKGAARSSMDGDAIRASFSDDYRYRLPTTPSSSSRLSTTNDEETPPRASISNDARVSMDSPHRRSSSTYAEDIQARFQEISSSSRGRLERRGSGAGLASATPKTSLSETGPRVSFSDDFPARPSLDTYRANISTSTPTSATVGSGEGRKRVSSELMSPLREQRASTANWSRYARRDSSIAAI